MKDAWDFISAWTQAKPHTKRRCFFERIIFFLLFACTSFSGLVTFLVISILLSQTVQFFSHVSFAQFFLDSEWTPLFAQKHFGIWPLICGTFIIAGIALSIALPVGLCAAIFLSEFASKKQRAILKPSLEILAGVPTVVFGYFALIFITPLLQKVLPNLAGFNALSAGIVLGIMLIPIVSSLSEDAIYAVPHSLREGAYGLGATRMQTIFKVILPSARSGIAASMILALSRAVGETMIVAIAAGQKAQLSLDPRESVQTMTAYIVQVSMGDVPQGTLSYQTIFAVGFMLFVITFGINWLNLYLSHRAARER